MRALLLSLIMIAAGTVGTMAQGGRITGIQWTLNFADGREVTSAIAYIQFEDDGRFSGSTGCNRMFGTAAMRGQGIAFSGIGSTKKMCKLVEGSVGEPVFLNALGKASRYSRSGNTLTIYDKRGRTLLRFERQVRRAPVEE